jgi:hypothetical protein
MGVAKGAEEMDEPRSAATLYSIRGAGLASSLARKRARTLETSDDRRERTLA